MLSVIVPVYNVEKYLQRCVDSILNQTYSDLEIILVDDGSTDRSGEICDIYEKQDMRVTVIHKKNEGPNIARFTALKMASGEYITFVDSDDYIKEKMYEDMMALFSVCNGDVDIVVGGYVLENTNGDIEHPFVYTDGRKFNSSEALYRMFENKIFNWSMYDKIYRRALFNHHDYLGKRPVSYGDDTYTNYKIFATSKQIAFIPLYAYHYCIREDSLMHQGINKNYFGYLDVYVDIIQAERNKKESLSCLPFIVRLMLSYYWRCFSYMQKNCNLYKHEIEFYRKSMIEYLSIIELSAAGIEQYQVDKLLLSCNEWIEFKRRRNQIIKNFIKNMNIIYIYGAGELAGELADELEQMGIPFHGFCVTRGQRTQYKGKEVFCINHVSLEKESVGFLLAMRKKYEEDVAVMLKDMGYSHILPVGKYSALYFV